MSTDGNGPADVGTRLAEAIESYLESAGKRDDHMAKLMTVMAKVMSDAQRRASAEPAPSEASDPAGAGPIAEILEKQSQINEMLVSMLNDQGRRTAEVEIKQLPAMSDAERRQDLVYENYDDKEIAFLKESEVFGALSEDTLRVILANSALETHPPGEQVFTIGDPVSEVYIIKSGIVEICRTTDDPDKLNVVAYLTSGDSIGEMSILISGDSRSSIARVPEGAEILAITHEGFMKLFKALPEMAVRLASVFARRLKTSIRKERIHTRHRELSGTLQYFDLPTVIQTLLSSDERTGVLTVYNGEQDAIAELFFEAGSIKYAKVGHLFGADAFYQLFQIDLSVGSFTFKERKFPEGFEQKAQIEEPGMSLLFEAARLSDELRVLIEEIPDPERVYKPKSEGLDWEDDATRTLANGVWNMLRRGATVSEILESLPRSHYSIYHVISELKRADLVE